MDSRRTEMMMLSTGVISVVLFFTLPRVIAPFALIIGLITFGVEWMYRKKKLKEEHALYNERQAIRTMRRQESFRIVPDYAADVEDFIETLRDEEDRNDFLAS